MIYEIKRYTDSDGRSITAKIPLLADESDGVKMEQPSFMGTIGFTTPRGVMPLNFEFLPAMTLEECFAQFDKFAQEMVEQIQDASRVVPASSMAVNPSSKGNIIMP